MAKHKVRQGECISSIAFENGFFWETIWSHGENRALKGKRKDPNVLLPGDEVFIPCRRGKAVDAATGQKHRFRRKGVPAKFCLRLLEDDEPCACRPYTLDIDGRLFSGTTDAEGRLEHPIPPNARMGKLLIGSSQDEYLLDFGHLDPVNEVSGIQARLNNLGLGCGQIDGLMGPKTEASLRLFQERHGLQPSGQTNPQTLDKLKEAHGS